MVSCSEAAWFNWKAAEFFKSVLVSRVLNASFYNCFTLAHLRNCKFAAVVIFVLDGILICRLLGAIGASPTISSGQRITQIDSTAGHRTYQEKLQAVAQNYLCSTDIAQAHCCSALLCYATLSINACNRSPSTSGNVNTITWSLFMFYLNNDEITSAQCSQWSILISDVKRAENEI